MSALFPQLAVDAAPSSCTRSVRQFEAIATRSPCQRDHPPLANCRRDSRRSRVSASVLLPFSPDSAALAKGNRHYRLLTTRLPRSKEHQHDLDELLRAIRNELPMKADILQLGRRSAPKHSGLLPVPLPVVRRVRRPLPPDQLTHCFALGENSTGQLAIALVHFRGRGHFGVVQAAIGVLTPRNRLECSLASIGPALTRRIPATV